MWLTEIPRKIAVCDAIFSCNILGFPTSIWDLLVTVHFCHFPFFNRYKAGITQIEKAHKSWRRSESEHTEWFVTLTARANYLILRKFLNPHYLWHNIVPPILHRFYHIYRLRNATHRKGRSFIPHTAILFNAQNISDRWKHMILEVFMWLSFWLFNFFWYVCSLTAYI